MGASQSEGRPLPPTWGQVNQRDAQGENKKAKKVPIADLTTGPLTVGEGAHHLNRVRTGLDSRNLEMAVCFDGSSPPDEAGSVGY